jgi:hypothetical protein
VAKKSWREKFQNACKQELPRVITINGKMSKRWGEGTCVIPSPLEVDAIMKRVQAGKLITINEIRQKVAKKHKATIGCPITTGIFAWLAAHAAAEDALQGKKRITPYWRTLKAGGEVNPKYPGGIGANKKLLEAEGHTVCKRGKKCIVVDYARSLVPV